MADTKEKILCAALRLFAREGYTAASVSSIGAELGLSKGALYRHYQNKRDIFDSILERMEQLDRQRAEEFSLPLVSQPLSCRDPGLLQRLRDYTLEQFRRWTQEEFSACFRRLLTLEQYRSPELAALYQQYLAAGPLSYVAALLRPWAGDQAAAAGLALEFYAPMFLLYSLYDGGDPGRRQAPLLLRRHVDGFCHRLQAAGPAPDRP